MFLTDPVGTSYQVLPTRFGGSLPIPMQAMALGHRLGLFGLCSTGVVVIF